MLNWGRSPNGGSVSDQEGLRLLTLQAIRTAGLGSPRLCSAASLCCGTVFTPKRECNHRARARAQTGINDNPKYMSVFPPTHTPAMRTRTCRHAATEGSSEAVPLRIGHVFPAAPPAAEWTKYVPEIPQHKCDAKALGAPQDHPLRFGNECRHRATASHSR